MGDVVELDRRSGLRWRAFTDDQAIPVGGAHQRDVLVFANGLRGGAARARPTLVEDSRELRQLGGATFELFLPALRRSCAELHRSKRSASALDLLSLLLDRRPAALELAATHAQ